MSPSPYGWGLPAAASTYAAGIDRSLRLLHEAMFLIFLLWTLYMAWCLFRYRAGRSAEPSAGRRAGWKSFIPDAAVLAFEVWLIFVFGLPLWARLREKLPKPADSTVVRLTAEQYAWIFHYPGPDGAFGRRDPSLVSASNPLGLDESDPAGMDDFVSIDELHAPLGRPVLLRMTSQDVIHSFFVPEFRVKQDIVPGMEIPLWFEPSKAGSFEIGCAQLCGSGHYRMRGDVIVTSPEDFRAWERAQVAAKGS